MADIGGRRAVDLYDLRDLQPRGLYDSTREEEHRDREAKPSERESRANTRRAWKQVSPVKDLFCQ